MLFANSNAIMTDAFPEDHHGRLLGVNGIRQSPDESRSQPAPAAKVDRRSKRERRIASTGRPAGAPK